MGSFAPHDISVVLSLVGGLPVSVGVFGGTYLQREIADVTISTYTFGNGVQGHIFVSWLHLTEGRPVTLSPAEVRADG